MPNVDNLTSELRNAIRQSTLASANSYDSVTATQNTPRSVENLQSELKQSITSGLASSINFDSTTVTASRNELQKSFDWRARLRPKMGAGNSIFWGGGENSLMGPIKQSNGLVWQYTPTFTYSASAAYHNAHMQGMNYSINTYNKSNVESFQVSSEMSANDIYEARYMLSAIHFLKVCTKSFFGDSAAASGLYGTPPPIMLFEYLGDHLFNKVPVVVTDYSFTFAKDVDYVPVQWNGTTTYVPTTADFSVTLLPTYNPTKLRTKFDLQKLKSGELYKDGFV